MCVLTRPSRKKIISNAKKIKKKKEKIYIFLSKNDVTDLKEIEQGR